MSKTMAQVISEAYAPASQKGVDATLEARGTRYGAFEGQAQIAQWLKRTIRAGNWDGLQADQQEALDMIANKMARILNGDPDYADSWHDIAGYARLVEQRLEKGQGPK